VPCVQGPESLPIFFALPLSNKIHRDGSHAHGPAVSGCITLVYKMTLLMNHAQGNEHYRGKDMILSLASGLLTIGSRFGGALDEAAVMFSNARDTGLTPREFVDESRKANKLST